MKEFKGTQGKWKVKHSESKTAYNVIGTNPGLKYKVARCPYMAIPSCDELNERDKEEAKANAQLIATAPELLEALQKAICYVPIDEEDFDDFARVINKALGKEK